jgi:diguanylate cyclase
MDSINRLQIILIISGVILIGIANLFLQYLLIWIMFLTGTVLLVWKWYEMSTRLTAARSQHLQEQDDMAKEAQEVRRKLSNYENILTAIGGAVYSLDLEEKNFDIENGFSDIFGIVTGERDFVREWNNIVHEEDLHRFLKFEKEVMDGNSSQVEYRIQHPNDGVRWVRHSASSIKDSQGKVTRISGHVMDITDRKKVELQWKQMAFFDELTDLPNRKALDSHISKALARSKRHAHNFSLMFIDLDGFKNVNDTLGHDAGDQLLIEVAQRLKYSVREEDLIARIGGDEFVVVFEESGKSEIEDIAKRIIKKAALPYIINDTEATVTVSLGISMYPEDGDTKETLLENADKAMYHAKNNGKNNYQLYRPELQYAEENKVGFLERWMNVMQNSFFNFS